jgi:septal ring factor EnvC (AmiA/AmiB activator)
MAATLPLRTWAQSDVEKAREQLQQLEKDIERINKEISNSSSRLSTLQSQLRDAETEIGTLNKDIEATRAEIKTTEEKLAEFNTQLVELEAARDEQKERITQELRSAWRSGSQGHLKILLMQDDPQTVARAMTYYRYVFEARDKLLEDYRNTLEELARVQSNIDLTLGELTQRRDDLEITRNDLQSAQEERKKTVIKINTSLIDSKSELEKRLADREELESLLRAIEGAVVNLAVPDNYQPFAKAQGKMPWPVPGKTSNRFGRPRNEGKMRWQGVTIPAKEGTTVAAIHHGRVVYADWLRGSGLLIIIDHGEGYMSLYAHNQSLLRDVGEWVSAGTQLANVGSTGGQSSSALYFEVRKDGKPIDPAKWCTN